MVEVEHITDDSRAVQPGSLFVAIKGGQVDGHQFVAQAQHRGAIGIVVDEGWQGFHEMLESKAVPVVYVPCTQKVLGILSAKLLGVPSAKMTMVGVTGTNGKTTVTHLAKAILEAKGHAVGLVGTVGYAYGGSTQVASHTTPGAVQLQTLLCEMVKAGTDVAVLEVSSHALAMDRVAGCEFDVVVFTNLTQDHLDFHASLEEYFLAKQRLFKDFVGSEQKNGPKRALINLDDEHASALIKGCRLPVWTFGIHREADIRARNVRLSMEGTAFSVQSPAGPMQIASQLVGSHNVSNMLAAIGIGLALGVTPAELEDALTSVRNVPGRFERIREGQRFTVIVDYAHTEDALYRLLEAARAVMKDGRLVTVFGCGGDRDSGKRPKMGRVAVQNSDWVILTSDNPRTEDPLMILSQIEQGIQTLSATDRCPYEVIPDRAQAIHRAIEAAGPDDVVLIAGKGHEDYQILGKNKIHFDDRAVARAAIRQRMLQI